MTFTFNEELAIAIRNLTKEVIENVPENGQFDDVIESVRCKEKTMPFDRLDLVVKEIPTPGVDDDKQRYVVGEVYGYDTMLSEVLLKAGTKNEIVEMLKSENFLLILEKALKKIVEKIELRK